MCATPISPNPSSMCVNCLRNQIDITDGISKQLTVNICKKCNRYLNPPNQWVFAELESKELLSICIKKVRGLNKVKLVDAGFVWTEPHSKRIKIKLTVQKEVFLGTILQQAFLVEYVVQSGICDACQKTEAKNTWNTIVQVRQKVSHKKVFYLLEQLILKHNAHQHAINIKERSDGLDFYYSHKNHAMRFLDFIQSLFLQRYKISERLISTDIHNGTAVMKNSISVEIVPICKDDLICLPLKLARSMGGISPLLLCSKVTTLLHMVDPFTLQTIEMSTLNYWTWNFRALLETKYLVEYTVLDITPKGGPKGKYQLADVEVVKSSDFGKNDTTYLGTTHLGKILKPGDYALGYDLTNTNFNDNDVESLKGKNLPDFILIKKKLSRTQTNEKRKTLEIAQLNER